MKPVAGVDLGQLVERSANDYIEYKSQEVLKQIRGMQNNVRSWSFQIERNVKENEKLQKKIDECNSRLERIKGGDWSSVPEEKDAANNENEKRD